MSFKVKNIEIFNLEGAIRGMRNPLESWDKSDSEYRYRLEKTDISNLENATIYYHIGENDLSLAKKLIKAGTDHRKFMRQIFVSMDITAPLYWWKEMDTYKIATVANSTSTMHKIASRLLTKDDFTDDNKDEDYFEGTLDYLNGLITEFQQTKNKNTWRKIIQRLPSSFNQTRTWTGNYENLLNIYKNRKNHKLAEWHEFCKMIEELPYSELITVK